MSEDRDSVISDEVCAACGKAGLMEPDGCALFWSLLGALGCREVLMTETEQRAHIVQLRQAEYLGRIATALEALLAIAVERHGPGPGPEVVP